ncbi:hypothetical protein [Pseudoalteromonas luteoviolacea]|uniref:Uncharacterized protein n=1 Tax=Pseudoalteromonas luteoviolacea S4054 TaxID=1129367 RepID=A0A0F6AE73_9GAMM|nr:hypothetical protein [Pseudoalteromonas luteoviolacea]AOT07993.1 hypothetical protein S4054249_09110 [Pseudoalteromonas luteoviolacea]AOT12909.1 hypothetical protein S40542_09110 [Pseudoalteromonas luteoviolacea]AOT17822.1 hypothetical protein S4054_09105 [Pseudoalteromonas luteoviolacea]KKE84458.1 hypothetical protein N479_09460 [Pseudoalteromonas luteoviolacea S4054]KZN71833.1 hypothetical protein N481_18000 [Pseudoalteromonas luteoviolacea S4047-1]
MKNNQTNIKELTPLLVDKFKLDRSQVTLLRTLDSMHPKCSSIYIEKSLFNTRKLDVSVSIQQPQCVHWYEYDAGDNFRGGANSFISFPKEYVKKDQQLKSFIYAQLQNSRLACKTSFLMLRLFKLRRTLPIEHYGYMGARKAKSLRICSAALTINELTFQVPKLVTHYDELFKKLSEAFSFKLSQNLSHELSGPVGIEVHAKGQHVTATWLTLITTLIELELLDESHAQEANPFIQKHFQLSKYNPDNVSLVSPAHFKLVFHKMHLIEVKIYCKANTFPFF